MDPPPLPSVDLLSSLPEHLQDDILTRLDLRDAVRTSVLSRAWRRRWETIPGLALSFPDGTAASVVDRVLLRYAGPGVSRFATHVCGDEDAAVASASHVNHWLIALSRRRVESISIFFHCGWGRPMVHSSIFSCHRLVSLTLQCCCIPPLPQPEPGGGFAGFPVLQELYLKCVHFADDGELRAMIGASPMLGVLVLDDVFYANDMDCGVIEAPNLHTLGFISCIDSVWRFGDLPRLQYASINVPDYAHFVDFLAGVSQVQELIFSLPVRDFEMDAIPFTFSNLKSMELWTHFMSMKHILFMFSLLRSSPKLEKVKIEVPCPKMVANQNFLNAQWTDGMCANLRVVEIISYKGWLPLAFIELILSKARCLRTLSVDACPVSQDDRLNELLNCSRASRQAQLLFKVQLEGIRFNHMKFAEKRLN